MNTTKFKKMVESLIMTPSLYIGFVIGSLLGAIGGGLGGGITGAITGYLYKGALIQQFNVCTLCPAVLLGYPISAATIDLLVVTLIGLTLGSGLGGIGTGLSTALCVYLNKKLPVSLSNETIRPLIKFCYIVAGVLSLSILLGALLGLGARLLFGPAIGAIFGFGLTLLYIINWIRHQ
ncbi:hypothetical protein [Legionella gresilensis]|uniref:hypothetical protein n=1 Tax=Legionella gresilensis TaxID=91823 RepID=UPI0010416015|nr:hypothetical protein [Legionella gresilensis]